VPDLHSADILRSLRIEATGLNKTTVGTRIWRMICILDESKRMNGVSQGRPSGARSLQWHERLQPIASNDMNPNLQNTANPLPFMDIHKLVKTIGLGD
jgi:hypothetical protein